MKNQNNTEPPVTDNRNSVLPRLANGSQKSDGSLTKKYLNLEIIERRYRKW